MKNLKTLFMATALVAAVGLLNSAYASQKFMLKGDAPTGTLLQTIEAVSSLPFDKRYIELTAEQRENFRARFQQLDLNEVPPFPRNGMQAIYRPLIEANTSAKRGVLSISVTVDEQGNVEELKVLDSPSKRLSRASVLAIQQTKFDPAICAGAPCKMEFPVQIKFL